MIAGIAGILAGALYILQQDKLYTAVQFIILSLAGAVAAAILMRYSRAFASFLLGCLIGIGWTNLHAYEYIKNRLPQNLESKTLTATGVISSLPAAAAQKTTFIFRIYHIKNETTPRDGYQVKLSWFQRPPALTPGDAWQLQIRLKRPHGFHNPGSFDAEAYAMLQSIHAVGYVLPQGENTLLARHHWSAPVDYIRYKLLHLLQRRLQPTTESALIPALTLGERSGITQAQWQIFRNTGTSHLMAISGLHIGLCAGFVFLLAQLLWRRSAYLCQRCPSPVAAAFFALLAALIYSLMAGFAVPTQRALVMLAVFMTALIFRKKIPVLQAYFIALAIVILMNPLALLSAGFWLSFGAVFLIIYGTAYRCNPDSLWWKWGRVQWVVTLGLIPLGLLFFQQLSLTAFFANIIAIPWVGLLVVPLALTGCLLLFILPDLATGLLKIATYLLKILWCFLAWLGSNPHFVWYHGVSHKLLFLLLLCGLLILLLPRGLPRWLSVFWITPFVLVKPAVVPEGSLWITVLDVGQGLAVVLQTRHHALIYDTGPRFSPGYDAGKAVLIPFLRQRGLSHVDTVILSHGDSDHIGGLTSILNSYDVNRIISSEPELFASLQPERCEQGMHWRWDDVGFRILYPAPRLPFITKRNNISCVLKVTVGNHAILLPGDIERAAEQYLATHTGTWLNADILIAPHHGSKTSSSPAFLKKVHPQYVVFSTGYRNRYHFPNKIIIRRYQDLKIHSFNTAESGAIDFLLSPQQLISVSSFREQRKRFWS